MIRNRGFTIFELILIMILLSIIIAMSTPFIIVTLEAWLTSKTERNLIFNARLAINRLAREIRQAKDIIVQPNSTWFNFTDINNNTIIFYQSGNSLYRNSDELTNLLNTSGGLNLSYFDANGNNTTEIELMRRVGIKLNLESANKTISVENLVKMRNML